MANSDSYSDISDLTGSPLFSDMPDLVEGSLADDTDLPDLVEDEAPALRWATNADDFFFDVNLRLATAQEDLLFQFDEELDELRNQIAHEAEFLHPVLRRMNNFADYARDDDEDTYILSDHSSVITEDWFEDYNVIRREDSWRDEIAGGDFNLSICSGNLIYGVCKELGKYGIIAYGSFQSNIGVRPTLLNTLFCCALEEVFRTPVILFVESSVRISALLNRPFSKKEKLAMLAVTAMHYIFDVVEIPLMVRILVHFVWNANVFSVSKFYSLDYAFWLITIMLMHDIETNPGPTFRVTGCKHRCAPHIFQLKTIHDVIPAIRTIMLCHDARMPEMRLRGDIPEYWLISLQAAMIAQIRKASHHITLMTDFPIRDVCRYYDDLVFRRRFNQHVAQIQDVFDAFDHPASDNIAEMLGFSPKSPILGNIVREALEPKPSDFETKEKCVSQGDEREQQYCDLSNPCDTCLNAFDNDLMLMSVICEVKDPILLIHHHFHDAHSFRLRYRDILLDAFKPKAQGDFDLLGTKALASSISDASNIINSLTREILVPEASKTREVVTDITKQVTDGIRKATKNVKVTHNFDNFFEALRDPVNSLVFFATVYVAIEVLDNGSDAFRIIKYLAGAAVLVYHRKYFFSLIQRWIIPTPQGDEGHSWVPILLEGIQLATTGFSVKLTSIDSLCKSLRDIESTSKAADNLITRILEWLKKAFTLVGEKVGWDFSNWFHSNDTKLKQLQKEAIALFQESMDNPMSLGVDYCERVTRLSMRVNDMITATPNTPGNSSINFALSKLQDKLYVLQRGLSDLGLTIGDRDDPAMITRVGAPGTGKTYDLDFHAQYLATRLADLLDLVELEHSWKSKIYVWPLDGKHHDQYMGQPITCFPDLFCQTDAKGMPSEAVYLVYLVGGQPLNLLAAEVTKKQKLWFLSKVIMACTNVTYIPRNFFESMHNPDALIRRVGEFCFYQIVNPSYIRRDAMGKPIVDPYTNKVRGYENCDELYAGVDKAKLIDHDPDVHDIYFFRRIDLSTGSFVDDKIYSTDDYYELSYQYVKSKMENGKRRREAMKSNAAKLIERRRQELATEPQKCEVVAMIDEHFAERMLAVKEESLTGYETAEEQSSEDEFFRDCWAVWSSHTSFNDRLSVAKDFVFFRQDFVEEDDFNAISIKFAETLCDPGIIHYAIDKDEEYSVKYKIARFLNGDVSTTLTRLRAFYSWLLENPKYDKVFSGIHIRYIVDMLSGSYERANKWYYYYYYRSNVINPIIASALFLKDAIVYGFNSLKAAVGGALDYLLSFSFFRKFWFYIREYVPALSALYLVSFLLGMLFETLRGKKKKKVANAAAQQDWGDDNQQYIRARQENFLALYLEYKDEEGIIHDQHPCNVMMLGARTGVMADHAYVSLCAKRKASPDRQYNFILVSFGHGEPSTSPIRFRIDDVIFVDDTELTTLDMRVFILPGGRNYPRLESCIPPQQCVQYLSDKMGLRGRYMHQEIVDFKNVNTPNLIPVRFRMSPNRICYEVKTLIPEGGHLEEKTLGSKDLNCWIFEGEHGSFRTVAGECISPGFITDERKNYCVNYGWKQAQQPWLAYLHIALGSYPSGIPIYRELFQKYFDDMKSNHINRMELLEKTLEEYSEVVSNELAVGQQCLLEFVPHQVKLDNIHVSVAEADSPITMVARSTIKRSPCYGLDERTRVPSRLKNFYIGDKYIDIMKQAREPYGSNTITPNYTLLRAISHDVAVHIYNQSAPTIKKEILTLDQALYGDAAYGMAPMNWNGSPGFMLRLVKQAYGFTGKGLRWMMEGDKLKPCFYNIISKLVDISIDRLRGGSRICNVYIDNLKDELLSKEKVKLGKTRLYCSSDRIYLILTKMYFGSFAGWIMENKIKNGIAIGVNPYSRDWDDIYSHLLLVSLKMIFGDYSKFDKKQLRVLMNTCLILMDIFYGDEGSENQRIRHLLFEDIVDSLHVVLEDGKLKFYCWDHGNTSGNFLTAILNSVVNIAIIFTCALIAQMIYYGRNLETLNYDFKEVADNIAYITLGDDVVISVGNRLPYVTFRSVKLICGSFLGIEFTDELKTDGDIPDYRSIEEGSFLGRKFRVGTFKSVRKIWAYLRRYSIVECVQWIKGIFDPEVEILKFEALNLEMSQGPSDDFYSVVPHYAKVCHEKYGRYPRYTNYEVAREKVVSLSCSKYSFDSFLCDDDEEGDSERLNQFLSLMNFDL